MDENFEIELYTVKEYLKDHMIHDLQLFGSLENLDEFQFERINVHMKREYWTTSQWGSLVMVDAVCVMHRNCEESLRRTQSIVMWSSQQKWKKEYIKSAQSGS